MKGFSMDEFLWPRLTWAYLARLCIVACAAYLLFGHICRPGIISGGSMKPTYGSFGVTFCWMPAYWFSGPKVGHVVAVKYIGKRTMLLKRGVALGGDTVEFRHGTLMVNGKPLHETWKTLGPCNWELPPRKVDEGCVYVVGDNRSMDMNEQIFGQVPASRILGRPIW